VVNKSNYGSWPLVLTTWLLCSVFVLHMAVDSLLGLILLGFVVFSAIKGRRFNLDFSDPLWLVAPALILYLGASLFWSASWTNDDVIQTWLRVILCFCFLVAVCEAAQDQEKFLKYLSLTLALCVLVSAIICFVSFADSPPPDGRIEGLFRLNNTGKAGRMYAVALPFLIMGFFMHSGARRALFVLAFACAIGMIILSDTRSAWLGGVVGISVYILVSLDRNTGTRLKYAAVLSIAILGALIAMIYHPDPEVTRALLPRGDSARLSIWANSLHQILTSSPWFGNGFLSGSHLQQGDWQIQGAHNIYLETAIKSGFFGLFIYLVLLVITALRLLAHLAQPTARLGLSILVMGIVMFIFNGDRLIDKMNIVWYIVWLPVGIAMALGRPARTAKSTS
jgi:O-antigen ligase